MSGSPAGVTVARTIAVGGAVALALFGSFLLVLTPSLGGHPGLQTVWVLVSLVLLKVPLLALVWWIIVRRRSRGDRAWSEEAARAFLSRTAAEVDRMADLPGGAVRLDGLQREVWSAVDRVDGAFVPELVQLGLRLDRLTAGSDRGRGRHDGPARVVAAPEPDAAG